MTTCAASQSPPALEPVVNHAFRYEASDIPPAITMGEFRSQRSGNRHRRGLHAWLRRLLSRGQVWAAARCKAPRPVVASPAQTIKGICDDDDHRASGRPGKDRGDAAPRGRDPAAPWAEEATRIAAPATSRPGGGRLQAASLNRRPRLMTLTPDHDLYIRGAATLVALMGGIRSR
jgi:hypothetical protein